MKKNNLFALYLLVASVALVSCEDLLTEKPKSYYESEEIFSTPDRASLAVIGIYNGLPSIYADVDGMAIPCSDDTYFVSGVRNDNRRSDIAHYTVRPSNTWLYSAWQGKYNILYRANYVISRIEQMEGYEGSDALKKLVGEAKFLRAQSAFDLARYWGDVPFTTEHATDISQCYLPRTHRELIYDQVLEDLSFAIAHLPWAESGSSPERATQGAARALLMRVLLTRAGYSLQMDGTITRPDEEVRKGCFEAVIKEWKAFEANGYHGFCEGGYLRLFQNFSAGTLDSKESIFEIAFRIPGAKGAWGSYIGVEVEEASSGADPNAIMGSAGASFRAVPEWRGFFEESDLRRDVAICTYKYEWDKEKMVHYKSEQNCNRWYPGKWRREWMPLGYKDPTMTDVNYCILRYADVVLMAAEAYNELGDTQQAWALLNRVRNRAGATEITEANYSQLLKSPKVYDLDYIDDSDGKGRFRTALYWERGFELAFEGQRKYDLIRWGIVKQALSLFGEMTDLSINDPQKQSYNYPAGINFRVGKHELFPIPDDELQINYKLEGINNPGY